jgi:GR25 family glycosyltransferase involved in LPS biosynthesis
MLRVISMPGTRRRALAQRWFERQALPWAFIDGVEVQHLTEDQVARICDLQSIVRRKGRALVRTEIGCALAHRNALEDFLQSGQPWTLIMEDDARPRSDFYQLMHQFMASPPDDVDLLIFLSRLTLTHTLAPLILGSFRFARVAGRADSTVAYWINRQTAQRMIEAQSPLITDTADWPLKLSQIRAYVSETPLVEHLDLDSHMPMGRAKYEWTNFFRQCLSLNADGARYQIMVHLWPKLCKFLPWFGHRVISHPLSNIQAQSPCDIGPKASDPCSTRINAEPKD